MPGLHRKLGENAIFCFQILILQERNADYFSQYVTENFAEYVRRKRRSHVHGNHLEIQALAEMYSRPIHIYSYSSEPINIFQHIPQSESDISIPMRLCYHRGVHYNSLVRSHHVPWSLNV